MDWAVFLLGVVLAFFWIHGIERGRLLGRPRGYIVRKQEPALFAIAATAYGTISIMLILAPLLRWTGQIK